MLEKKKSRLFKKDFKLAVKRGLNITKLIYVIDELSKGNELPESYKVHSLQGVYNTFLECHIDKDWLLIYRIENNSILYLCRTGTHSDLFSH